MVVQFLREHFSHKEGDTAEVTEETGNYLIRCGVAESYELKEKKETKSKREKKEITNPGAE